MVTTLNITLDDDVADRAREVKDNIGVTWAEFIEVAADAMDEPEDTVARSEDVADSGLQTPDSGTDRETRSPRDSTEETALDDPALTVTDSTPSPERLESDGLGGVEFPASVDRDEAELAVLSARAFLQETGGASMREIVATVMPEHSLGYDVPEIEDGDLVTDRYRGAWWRRVVKPGLKALEEVEAPARGQSRWRYTGDDASTNSEVYDPTSEF